MILPMHSYFGWNKTWQQSRLTYNSESCFLCLLHVYPQGLLLMGIFGNMTVFLGSSSRLSCYLTCHLFSFFPSSHPSPPPLSPSCPSCLPFILVVSKQVGTGKSMLQYETTIPISQEGYKWWSGCCLRIHFLAFSMLLPF